MDNELPSHMYFDVNEVGNKEFLGVAWPYLDCHRQFWRMIYSDRNGSHCQHFHLCFI